MMKHFTVCFLFSPSFEYVLLVRKAKTCYAERLNGLGGRLEEGETSIECARRKIKEESGSALGLQDLFWVGNSELPVDCTGGDVPVTGHIKLHYFAAIVDINSVRPLSDLGEELVWQRVRDVLDARICDATYAGDGDVLYWVGQSLRVLKNHEVAPLSDCEDSSC